VTCGHCAAAVGALLCAAGDSAIELVSLADRLRQAAEQTRGHVPRSARTLQLQGLVLALRGLSLTPAVRAGAGELFRAIDREAMSGRALLQADAFAVLLRDAADRLATAADAGGTAALPELLLPLVQRLDEMRGTDGAEAVDVMPIEALAPEIDNDTDVVPIESLLYEGAAAVAPRFLPFERTFTTYFRLLSEETAATDGPIVPIASLAPEPVASLSSGRGTPNSIRPPTPAATASVAATRSESSVCWKTPGIEEISRGASMPSATNIGSTRCRGSSEVSATRRRIAAVLRRRRGRSAGKIMPSFFGLVRG